MQRRHLLAAGGTLALAGRIRSARAAWAPTRPIEIVAHNGPGSGPDVFARAMIAAIEQDRLFPGRIQVANRVGGGGATAMNYMVERRGDPHVIGVWTSLWMSLPLVQAEARAQVTDMTPIARVAIEPAVMIVRGESPYRSVGDFVTAARERPGQVRQSGGSPTARDALVRQLLMARTGTRWAFISFPSGGERMAALLGGHVDMMVAEPAEIREQVRAGRLRILATVTAARLSIMPDVPTLAEAGFPIADVIQARGLIAPPGIPEEAVAFYGDLFSRMAQGPAWRKYVTDNELESAFLSPTDTGAFFRDYQGQLREILQTGGVRLAR